MDIDRKDEGEGGGERVAKEVNVPIFSKTKQKSEY